MQQHLFNDLHIIRVMNAQIRADQPIDDSAVVDDMFGFLEDQKDNISESQAPSAFRDLPAPKVLCSLHFVCIIFCCFLGFFFLSLQGRSWPEIR